MTMKPILGRDFINKIADALGLPDDVSGIEIKAEVGGCVTLMIHRKVHDQEGKLAVAIVEALKD